MKKNFAVIILILCAVFVLLPCAVFAETVSGECGASVKWTFDDDGTLTVSGEGAMEDYQMYPPAPWCDENIIHKIKSVKIENGVTSVGSYAFAFADKIENVSIADSVSTIGDGAFSQCSSIAEITVPSGVTHIGNGVFKNCLSLSAVNADGGGFVSEDGVLFDKDKTEIIVYPPAKDADVYSLPDGVLKIHDSAFYSCKTLTEINIPDSVREIGDWAFDYCYGLTSAKLGSNLWRVGDYAFENCKALAEITVPDSVTYLGQRAFCSCINLKTARVGNGVTELKSSAFNSCAALDSVILPNTLKTIGDYVFNSCDALVEINIPSGVKTIGESAFAHCNALSEIAVPSSVETIGKNAFYGCAALARANISDGVLSIGADAFYRCDKLVEINIPNSVTEMGKSAFYMCESLASVTLGDALLSIPEDAFYGCGKLQNVHIGGSVETIGSSAFNGCKKIADINIPASVTRIERYAFNLCTGLKDVYYDGTRSQWDEITIGTMNKRLLDAVLHCAEDLPIPEIEIDYAAETLTGFENGGAYTIDGEAVSPENGALAIGEYIGKTIAIVKKGGENTSDSMPQTLTIPPRPAAPSATSAPVTRLGENDGKIIGVSVEMEYRPKGGDWRDCPENDITGLDTGSYEIRLKATESRFHGETENIFVDLICVKITAMYDGVFLDDLNIEKVNLSEITPHENNGTSKIFYRYSLDGMKPVM